MLPDHRRGTLRILINLGSIPSVLSAHAEKNIIRFYTSNKTDSLKREGE